MEDGGPPRTGCLAWIPGASRLPVLHGAAFRQVVADRGCAEVGQRTLGLGAQENPRHHCRGLCEGCLGLRANAVW